MDAEQPKNNQETTEKPVIERIDESKEQPVSSSGVQPAAPKKASKKKLIILITVVIVLLIAITTVIYFILTQNAKKTVKNQPATATHFVSAEALVTQAKTGLSGAILQPATMNGLGGTTADNFSTYSFPVHQVDGKSFKNLPESGTGVGYSGELSTAEANYAQLVKFFETNHFKVTNSKKDTAGPISGNSDATFLSYAEYSSNDMLCAIWNADASQTSLKAYIASVGCATIDSYKKAADALQPFYASYTKQDPSLKNLVFGVAAATEGDDGYKGALIYQEDPNQDASSEKKTYFNGLYYQAPNTTEWTYYADVDTDSMLNCAAFKSEIAKKAFKGFNCYDETTKKPVKV